MELHKVVKGKPVIVPGNAALAGKRCSISSTKFEVRKCSTSGGSLRGEWSQGSKLCFRMADLFMTMVVVFPLSIGFWRGVWQLMEFYSDVWKVGPWLSIAVGYLIPFFLYLYQEPLKRTVVPGKMNFFVFYLISRTLLLLHSFGSVNQWRGLWQLLDDETGLGPTSALGFMTIGIGFSLIFRTFSNVLAPPLFCCVDEAHTLHDCPLRFKTEPSEKCKYLLDCLFSVGVIPSLTVCSWRGLWNLADLYLYPEDPYMSAMASLGLGYSVCIILCASQPIICEKVCNLRGLMRLLIIDTAYMIGFIGCVFAWRGCWNCYNIFIVFETPNLSEWVTTIVGTVGTVLFGCVSTVMVRGIAIDGALAEDETAEWLIPYISLLRSRVDDVPFPEPWICRYLCTSQKMNSEKIRAVKRVFRKDPSKPGDPTDFSGAAEPLRKIHNIAGGNSLVHPQRKSFEETSGGRNASSGCGRVRLSQIPHIDSSSEEELGFRHLSSLDQANFNSESLNNDEQSSAGGIGKSRLEEVVTMPTN